MDFKELTEIYALLFYPALFIYGLTRITCTLTVLSYLALGVFITSLMTLFYLNYELTGLIVSTGVLLLLPLIISPLAFLITKTKFTSNGVIALYKCIIR